MGTRPEYDFKAIGRKLRAFRKRQHLSVEQVREYMMLGSVQAIYKWERGESLPQADSLFALMSLYRIDSFSELVEESKELSSFDVIGTIFKKSEFHFLHQKVSYCKI